MPSSAPMRTGFTAKLEASGVFVSKLRTPLESKPHPQTYPVPYSTPITVLSEAEIYVNCFTNSKFAFVTGCDFGAVSPNASCAMALSPHPYTTALEFASFLNCPLLAASVPVNGNVSVGSHQSTASTVLTSVLDTHFAVHARTNLDTESLYTSIVTVIVLSSLHAPTLSINRYVIVVVNSRLVSVSSHGATKYAVCDPANRRADTVPLASAVQ
mmetsp:Transcript_3816/g.14684  ORF Transcript_3816/g.14684 Transcript_3816/m.14684 type:complete len:213 (-) Transcript_3816:144-782(-)